MQAAQNAKYFKLSQPQKDSGDICKITIIDAISSRSQQVFGYVWIHSRGRIILDVGITVSIAVCNQTFSVSSEAATNIAGLKFWASIVSALRARIPKVNHQSVYSSSFQFFLVPSEYLLFSNSLASNMSVFLFYRQQRPSFWIH